MEHDLYSFKFGKHALLSGCIGWKFVRNFVEISREILLTSKPPLNPLNPFNRCQHVTMQQKENHLQFDLISQKVQKL